jgi:hypothetical protein
LPPGIPQRLGLDQAPVHEVRERDDAGLGEALAPGGAVRAVFRETAVDAQLGQHLAKHLGLRLLEPVEQKVGRRLWGEPVCGVILPSARATWSTSTPVFSKNFFITGKPSLQSVLPALTAIKHTLRLAP